MSGIKTLPDEPTPIDAEELDKALASAPNEPPVVNIRCRRNAHVDNRAAASSGDVDLQGVQCKSTTSFDMTALISSAPGHHMYRCTECGYSWAIAVGGSFNI